MDMDGLEIRNDVAIADDNEEIPEKDEENSSKDTETIHLDSGDTEKIPAKGEGSRALVELGEAVAYMIEPKVGMIFETAQDAYNFYDEYARMIGFRVRTKRTNMNQRDRRKIHRQRLVCSCEGFYEKIGTPRKRRENRRFDCKAAFEFKLAAGKYTVIHFISEHSHALVRTQYSQLLRPQKKLEPSQVGLNNMQSSGQEPSMSAEVGEGQHVNIVRSDCNDSILRTRDGFFMKGDAQFLQNYLKQKKQENRHFSYSFRINEEGEINGVFFCDAKSRRDYALFGDVMCCDTTFKKDKHSMVCAIIVGINNHGQTALFGCGLLDGETIDAMVWLFTTFLEAMGGKKPISIFTDESATVASAVSFVFPKSYHGLSLWNIHQHAGTNISKFKSIEPRFVNCIYDPETAEEFEQSWSKLLEDHGLRENEWLQGLYKSRQKLAQVYGRDHFCAGVTTIQRSKSIKKFLKDNFCGSFVLREFVGQYSKAMVNQREKEKEAENKTQQTSPILISGWLVEREAAQKYTKEMFYCFQEEFRQTIDQRLQLEKCEGEIRTYRITEMEGRKKSHTVTYNHSEQSVFCTCGNFEFNGILCSHALKVFRDLEFTSLPPRYYLKRWTMAVVDEVVFDSYGDAIPSDIDPLSMTLYNELSHISQRIVTKGAKSKDVCSLTKLAMLELEAKVEAWTVSEEERRLTAQKRTSTSVAGDHSTSNLETTVPKKKASSKPRGGGGAETVARTQRATGASDMHQPTQESFGLVQQPSYNQNGWQNMHPRPQGIYPQGTNPQGFCPVYNFMGSQEQNRNSPLPSDLFTFQQASSSQTHVLQEMPQRINFSTSPTSNFMRPSSSEQR